MSYRVLIGEVDRVDTVQRHALGQIFEVPEKSSGDLQDMGATLWMYVKNDEAAAAFAVGQAIQRKAGATTVLAEIKAAGVVESGRVLGFAQHIIAAQSYGFIQISGIGQILCDGSVSADTMVIADTNLGQVTDRAAVTDYSLALALATDAGAASLVAADIRIPR